MTRILLTITFILIGIHMQGQTIKERAIDASIGYGISSTIDFEDLYGSGLYLQSEYVLVYSKWLELRPYAGLILTSTNNDPGASEEFEVTTNALLFGGKARLTAPIPWIAPYVELGFGGSVGKFTTITPLDNLEKNGVQYHIPLSIGVNLGPDRNFDIEFTYYFMPGINQYSGAAAIGISFPLKS